MSSIDAQITPASRSLPRLGRRSRCAYRRIRLLQALIALSASIISPSAMKAQAKDEGQVLDALESASQALKSGRPGDALQALDPIERLEPLNPWLWFYRGSAYYQREDYYRAIDCFDSTLDILDGLADDDAGHPDPELAQAARKLRRRARQQVFSLSFQTGIAFDSNVSFQGSGTAGLDVITGRGDGVFGTGFNATYAPISDGQQRLEVSARLAHSWHFSVEEFDYQNYGASIDYARRLSDRWTAAIRYDYDFTYLGYDPFYSIHRLSPRLTYRWEAPVDFRLRPDETTVYYSFEGRDFRLQTIRAFDRDGTVHSVGMTQTFRSRPLVDHVWEWFWSLGYRYDSVFTDGTEFARRQHNFFMGLEIPLIDPRTRDHYKYLIFPDKELLFRFNTQWLIADYSHHSIIDRNFDKRSDLIYSLGIALSQVLIDDPDFGEMVLHAVINWTDADSNVTSEFGQPFTYDKTLYGLQLEWKW